LSAAPKKDGGTIVSVEIIYAEFRHWEGCEFSAPRGPPTSTIRGFINRRNQFGNPRACPALTQREDMGLRSSALWIELFSQPGARSNVSIASHL
jgi:hypothetical protein